MNLHLPFHPDAARAEFDRNFSERAELGASVSVFCGETELLDWSGGSIDRDRTLPWTSDTPVLVWSATKGPSAACLLHALDDCGLSLETPVPHFWPEFAAAGKESVTVRMLLQHQAGLCALDTPPPAQDHAAVAAALAAQTPAWEPGTAHGYHPRTYGFLLEETLRRLLGVSLGEYWRAIFAEPLQLEFWIGVPEAMLPRVAPVHGPRSTLAKGDPFLTAFLTPGSLTARAFASPKGLHTAGSMNEPAARLACYPGWGGIGTARALAKFYAMLACDGCLGSRRFLPSKFLRSIACERIQGPDPVLHMESAFSLGFMRDPLRPNGSKLRRVFGPSHAAFGHPGAGGSVAFADPDRGIGFAYVMNQMEPGVLPSEKCSSLVDALLGPSDPPPGRIP
ncbi:MAG: hypothetical protein RLZZ142_1526 [Verrucomicrobiota bacterium]